MRNGSSFKGRMDHFIAMKTEANELKIEYEKPYKKG